MKLNFKKISTIAASALMASMTVGLAAAAAYPAPFISGGTANVAIVYGTGSGVSSLDLVEAANIQSNLQSKMGTSVGSTSTVSGEAESLASGSDLLYLLDDLAENVPTLTKDDLPTILADIDFVDDDGTTWEGEQTISIGTSTTNRFSFGNSDSDFDDPALMIELSSSTSTPMYTWTLSFDAATPLNATASEGEEITIFGKTYTIGTATDGDTLILLGGSSAQKIYVDETVTMEVNGNSYDVSLDGLSSDATTVASLTINGETKTFTQGQTKTFTFGDVELEVYMKTVFRTGDDGSGHVEVELGADKITIENGNAVQVGSDTTDIDGTAVTVTGTAGNVMGSVTKLEFAVAAPDSDENHILVGGAFTDPIFGTLKLEFSSVGNGPVFTEEEDTGRTTIELKKAGSRELEIKMTDSAGTEKTIPFTYRGMLTDDASNPFVTVEGNNLTDDDYFILNSGDYQHLMRVTKVNIDTATTSDVEITDQFTTTTYKIENKDMTDGENITINNQIYTVMNTSCGGSAAGINITRAGTNAETHRAIFPYLELVAGDDYPRVTFVNQTNNIADTVVAATITSPGDNITAVANGTPVNGLVYDLPTGSVQFRYTDLAVDHVPVASDGFGSFLEYMANATGSTGTWTNVTNVGNVSGTNYSSIQVGEAAYIFGTTTCGVGTAGANSIVITNVTLNAWFNTTTSAVADATGGGALVDPAILFVEDKDKSDGEVRNAIILNTSDDGTYSELSGAPLFSGTSQYDTESWDTTELTGYLTNYGTYVLRDQTDTNQNTARLTYGNAQMYADVYFAEVDATITAGTTGGVGQIGDILVKDSEVSSVATKNLIVVGGSCINSAAATLVGSAACGASFTTATGVGSGQFIIKGYDSSSLTNKLALLVAGYDAADTVNAATYLRNKGVDTGKEYLGTSANSATLVTSSA